jgi:hypothetical protein
MMKRVSRMIRVLTAGILATIFASQFYGDLFVGKVSYSLISYLWWVPCLHLVLTGIRFFFIITGKQYRRTKEFSLIKTKAIRKPNFFSKRIQMMSFFFLVNDDGKERIVSGIFFRMPLVIFVYRDPLDRLKTISPGDLFFKVMPMVANIFTQMVIKLLMARWA